MKGSLGRWCGLGKSAGISAISVLLIFICSSCGNSVQKVEHIEAFTIENSEEQNNGRFGKVGYMKVNAVTLIEESDNHIETDVKKLEDYYSEDGTYLKTTFSYTHFIQSKLTRATDSDDQKLELSEPSTILVPDLDGDNFKEVKLTAEEEVQVKEHVLSFMEN